MIDKENKIEVFFNELSDAMDIENIKLTKDTKLSEIPWDSLAIISTIAIFDSVFDVVLKVDSLSTCNTLGDIIELVKEKK